jgi:hypothetical protein
MTERFLHENRKAGTHDRERMLGVQMSRCSHHDKLRGRLKSSFNGRKGRYPKFSR